MRNNTFKALAHPDRRKVLTLLRSGPKLAGELASEFKSSWPTISRHIALLKSAGLISAERQGTQILYRINTSVVEDTANTLLNLIGSQSKNETDISNDGSNNLDQSAQDNFPSNYKEAAE